jgi:hypothetical protein
MSAMLEITEDKLDREPAVADRNDQEPVDRPEIANSIHGLRNRYGELEAAKTQAMFSKVQTSCAECCLIMPLRLSRRLTAGARRVTLRLCLRQSAACGTGFALNSTGDRKGIPETITSIFKNG